MRFPFMWTGNSDVARSLARNKQMKDTKEQRLYYVLHIIFIRRWLTRSDLARVLAYTDIPVVRWNCWGKVPITSSPNAAGLQTDTRQTARLVLWVEHSRAGNHVIKRRVKAINTNGHCGSNVTLDKYPLRVEACHVMGTVHLYRFWPLASSKEWPVFGY